MDSIINLIQIAIKHPIGVTLAAIALLMAVKFTWVLLSDIGRIGKAFLFRYTIRPTFANGVIACVIGIVLSVFRNDVSDYLQAFEQTALNPVYQFEYTPDDAQAVRILEAEIQKKIGTEQFNTLKAHTLAVADSLGCNPLTVYQIALSECDLNPFVIRDDGVAAGWMQLTNNGCEGLKLDGSPVTMHIVKAACRAKNIDYIMRSSSAYLLDRANGKTITGMKDFYMLVFAPAFVGAADNVVLYQGYNNPSYYLNSGFDGYYLDSAGRICRLNKMKDGKITAGEVALHVQKKYINFIKKHK